jgi:hypothetical protein
MDDIMSADYCRILNRLKYYFSQTEYIKNIVL